RPRGPRSWRGRAAAGTGAAGRAGDRGLRVGVVVGLDFPGAVLLDQGVHIAVARLLGRPIIERGTPRLIRRGGGAIAVHGDRAPLDVDQLDLGHAVDAELVIGLDLLLVEVGGGRRLQR